MAEDIEAEVNDHEIIILRGDRRYRVRGLQKNMSHEQLKVNLLVSRQVAMGDTMQGYFYVDTLDIYSAKHRAMFIARECDWVTDEAIKHDMGHGQS